MSDILFAAFWFLFGFCVGTGLVVYQASRPEGYLANNGNRYRLTQLPRPSHEWEK